MTTRPARPANAQITYWAPLLILFFGALILLRHIVLTVTRGVDTPLSDSVDPALHDSGRIPWDVFDSGPRVFLAVGIAVAAVALVSALVSLVRAAMIFHRRGFVPAINGWLATAAVCLFLWPLGKLIEHMGNNYAAQALAQDWTGDTVGAEALVLWYLGLASVCLLDFYLRKGQPIQKEQEDLV